MNIKFILIGCGRIARRHAEQMAVYGRLMAVCDVAREKADQLAALYNARAYYDIDDLLANEKADVLSVCTPNGLHAAHAVKGLKAGLHVLCEKPMAIHVQDCLEMMDASEKYGKRLFIVKQNRFNPPVEAVKKLIDNGTLGRIFSVQLNCFWNRDEAYYQNSWKGTLELDGGTLFTQFSHFIDLLYWMLGDVKQVQALLANYAHQGLIEFEDSGVAILEFVSGVTGTLNYTVNSHHKNMEGSLTIFAEKGTVKIGGQYLNELEYQDIENHIIRDLPAANPANQYGHYQGSMSNHNKVYENLVAALQTGIPYITTPYEGMKTVEIIERIYKDGVRVAG